MGDGSGRNHNNKRIMNSCFDCVPRTKPIEVITKQSGTGPQRGEPKGSDHNTVSKSVEVKVRI